jgi:hypothetical protein
MAAIMQQRPLKNIIRLQGDEMASSIETIFEHEKDGGKTGALGIDDEARLYWNGQLIVTEQKVKLSWWVNFAIIISGLSTLIIAIFTAITYLAPIQQIQQCPPVTKSTIAPGLQSAAMPPAVKKQ